MTTIPLAERLTLAAIKDEDARVLNGFAHYRDETLKTLKTIEGKYQELDDAATNLRQRIWNIPGQLARIEAEYQPLKQKLDGPVFEQNYLIERLVQMLTQQAAFERLIVDAGRLKVQLETEAHRLAPIVENWQVLRDLARVRAGKAAPSPALAERLGLPVEALTSRLDEQEQLEAARLLERQRALQAARDEEYAQALRNQQAQAEAQYQARLKTMQETTDFRQLIMRTWPNSAHPQVLLDYLSFGNDGVKAYEYVLKCQADERQQDEIYRLGLAKLRAIIEKEKGAHLARHRAEQDAPKLTLEQIRAQSSALIASLHADRVTGQQ